MLIGNYITVNKFQHRIGGQGEKYTAEASNVIKEIAAKLQDGADPHLPAGQLHAVAWMVTANSEQELAAKLTEVCAVLPLPEWCATMRRLIAENDLMAKPAAAIVPRWKEGDPLIWDPLRRHLLVYAARDALQQSEGNSPSPEATHAKLAALTRKRDVRIAAMDAELATKPSLAGKMWSWHGYGDPASIAAQLQESDPPDHSHAVGALLLSHEPLTYWQELTQ
ncbi:hypothetical protein [Aeromonas hydrophila]|uniref:Uncharacterized protein n=1 Tax=Aeromonas hydrophila TaxID=644 RepID=A0AAX3P7H0_AERHY|nr:hypothetical protein [Aeromonas hydrophila]WEE26734.1 hypothetical protein PY771_24715 [Aeromonas hydrophila]